VVDRRIVVVGLVACGLAAGWFLRILVAPHLVSAADRPLSVGPMPSRELPDTTETTASRQAAFDSIYRKATWGINKEGVGNSGFGSKLRATLLYRTFLEQMMKDLKIHSVVDAGCGDWEFSQAIDWTGIDYKGYDIVPSVIEHDKAKYAKPNIEFINADIVETDLPPADLLISKHVLQHLPNADVQKFLTKQLGKYKYIVLTNGVMRDTLSSTNPDIKPGQYRPLDLTRPPFNLAGAKVLSYWDGWDMHQVLFITGKTEADK
jgi:SAM-dependent methyltransferase